MGLLDWLKHGPSKPAAPRTVGLALGGGGVRGAAHLGVLEVLEREGIKPDLIVGTSAGAIIGAGYASGLAVDEMLRVMRSLKWSDLTRLSLPGRLSVLDTTPLRRFVEDEVGGRDFADLDVPFAAVACDVLTGEAVVLREGSVAEAVTASSAVPGLFPPVEWRDRLLIDGGTVANLPVRVARDLGADYVIAVDIVPDLTGDHRPHNVRDMLLMTFDIRSRATQAADEQAADCLICPALAGSPPWDFSLVDEMEALGRAAAGEALPRLQAALDGR
ncbi:MAG: patatin-like phospholipase family protein [Anaerosomatales bacterium]